MAARNGLRPGHGLDLRVQTSEGKEATLRRCCSAGLLRPAAIKAGVIDANYRGRFGWHNLRHSLATFLADNDVSLSVIQRMLASFEASNDSYLHASNQCCSDGSPGKISGCYQGHFGSDLRAFGLDLGLKFFNHGSAVGSK